MRQQISATPSPFTSAIICYDLANSLNRGLDAYSVFAHQGYRFFLSVREKFLYCLLYLKKPSDYSRLYQSHSIENGDDNTRARLTRYIYRTSSSVLIRKQFERVSSGLRRSNAYVLLKRLRCEVNIYRAALVISMCST